MTLNSEVKTEYLVSKATERDNMYWHVELKDYIYSMDPKAYEQSYELILPIEYIRGDVEFYEVKDDLYLNIINQNEQITKWINYKEKGLNDNKFYQLMMSENAELAKDFIKKTEEDFLNKSHLEAVLLKNMFFHVLVRSSKGSNLKDHTISQLSQIFPGIMITVNIEKHMLTENEHIKKFRLVGTLDKSKLVEDELIKLYDEIYKPMLKYGYTEFDYIYRMTYTIDAKTSDIIEASVTLSERVKNNFECITQFKIKSVEL